MSHRPGRARAGVRHPRCPYRLYFPNRAAATEAGTRLGSVPVSCARCGGFHLDLPTRGGHR